jgi:YidC/Oxa1 family membrane protein insertase
VEERQILRAFLLMFLVVTVYYTLFPPQAPRPREAVARPTPAEAAAPPAQAPEAAAAASPARAVDVPRVAAEAEYRVEVETPDVVVAFKNRGARLVSWKLTHYRDAQGQPEEMVQTTTDGPLPFDLDTGDADVDTRLKEALFKASTERLVLAAAEEGRVVFDFADGDLVVRKEFRFSGKGYVTEVSASVKRDGREVSKRILWGPGVGHPSAAERKVQGFEDPNGAALVGDDVARTAAKSVGAGVTYNEVKWIGIEGRHFTALWAPPPSAAGGELRRVELPGDLSGAKRPAVVALVGLGTAIQPAQLYVGPKDYYVLKNVEADLVRVVPIGDWIGGIVVFMMDVLRWLYGYSGNYGWAIVLLTVMISLIMAPIRHYGIVNGRKMAKMAPELKVIQERYRKMTALDPRRQEMHKEMQVVYERHGMNMMGQMLVGCLPLLITMPFLFAVYKVLNVSIDLRGSEFLWIPDLSHSDPYFITPLLMGCRCSSCRR